MRWAEITEVFGDKDVELEGSGPKRTLRFEVGGEPYYGEFYHESDTDEDGKPSNEWTFAFSSRGQYGDTGKQGSSAVQVFSHVIAGIRKLVATAPVDAISFEGNKAGDRDGFYARLLKRFEGELNSMGFGFKTKEFMSTTHFRITRL